MPPILDPNMAMPQQQPLPTMPVQLPVPQYTDPLQNTRSMNWASRRPQIIERQKFMEQNLQQPVLLQNAQAMQQFNAATELARLQEAQQRTREYQLARMAQQQEQKKASLIKRADFITRPFGARANDPNLVMKEGPQQKQFVKDFIANGGEESEAIAIWEGLKQSHADKAAEALRQQDSDLRSWHTGGFQPAPMMPVPTTTPNMGVPSYMKEPTMPQMVPQIPEGAQVAQSPVFGTMVKPQKPETPPKPYTPPKTTEATSLVWQPDLDEKGIQKRGTDGKPMGRWVLGIDLIGDEKQKLIDMLRENAKTDPRAAEFLKMLPVTK